MVDELEEDLPGHDQLVVHFRGVMGVAAPGLASRLKNSLINPEVPSIGIEVFCITL